MTISVQELLDFRKEQSDSIFRELIGIYRMKIEQITEFTDLSEQEQRIRIETLKQLIEELQQR